MKDCEMNFKLFLENEMSYVYHVSPRSDIKRLRPTGSHRGQQSVKMNNSGIYVAPKFKDAVAWALSYVLGKKYSTQRPTERAKELGKGWHSENFRGYENLTIYKIQIPSDILKNSWYNSFWEPEFFIPSDSLDQMHIVSSKTYSIKELNKLYQRSSAKKMEVRGKDINLIKKASKNNIAARYYLELLELYNQRILSGGDVIPDFSETLDQFKKYIFEQDFLKVKIIDLNKDQISIVNKLYKDIKNKLS